MGMRFNWSDCGPRGGKGFPEALIGLAAASRGWGGPGGPEGWSFEWGGGRGGRGGHGRRNGRAGRRLESGALRMVLCKQIELGREVGRERGCLYWEITEGDITLQEKNTNNDT